MSIKIGNATGKGTVKTKLIVGDIYIKENSKEYRCYGTLFNSVLAIPKNHPRGILLEKMINEYVSDELIVEYLNRLVLKNINPKKVFTYLNLIRSWGFKEGTYTKAKEIENFLKNELLSRY